MRARFAVGCFERVACWNGHSRSLVGTPCGIEAAPGSRIDMGMQAALFGLSAGWQVRPHLFTGVRQQFEPDDIDRCALLPACLRRMLLLWWQRGLLLHTAVVVLVAHCLPQLYSSLARLQV